LWYFSKFKLGMEIQNGQSRIGGRPQLQKKELEFCTMADDHGYRQTERQTDIHTYRQTDRQVLRGMKARARGGPNNERARRRTPGALAPGGLAQGTREFASPGPRRRNRDRPSEPLDSGVIRLRQRQS
jgi:hypothetical protein